MEMSAKAAAKGIYLVAVEQQARRVDKLEPRGDLSCPR